MRRFLLVLVFLVVAAPAIIPAAAQDVPPEGCTRAGFATMFSDAAHLLEVDDTADDPDILATTLSFFLTEIQTRRAACAEWSFSGDTNEVIGPVRLPAGDYIARLSLDTMGTVTASTLDSDCERVFIGLLLSSFELSGGVDEAIIQTDANCRVLFDVATTRPWTLALIPVN